MSVEYVGYRQLYNALSCGLEGQEEFGIGFRIGDCLCVEVYFGPRPRFGLLVEKSGDRYFAPAPGLKGSLGELSHARDPAELNYPHRFFCEVACFKAIEVSEQLSNSFHRREQEARDKMLDMAEKEEEPLKETINLIAGVVGLRFHRRLVLELLNENPLVLFLDEKDDFVKRHTGDWLTIVPGGVVLKQDGLAELSMLLPTIGAARREARDHGATIFKWLLRAWSEQDSVSTFVDLFIPLEIILQGYGDEGQESKKEQSKAVENLIRQHGSDEKETLLEYFNRLKRSWRPSLQSRFELMAREAGKAGHPDWEADVKAFGKFNRIRNDLLHRGKDDIELQVDLGEETQELEDLVERYTCFALFRDMRVYREGMEKA